MRNEEVVYIQTFAFKINKNPDAPKVKVLSMPWLKTCERKRSGFFTPGFVWTDYNHAK